MAMLGGRVDLGGGTTSASHIQAVKNLLGKLWARTKRYIFSEDRKLTLREESSHRKVARAYALLIG